MHLGKEDARTSEMPDDTGCSTDKREQMACCIPSSSAAMNKVTMTDGCSSQVVALPVEGSHAGPSMVRGVSNAFDLLGSSIF